MALTAAEAKVLSREHSEQLWNDIFTSQPASHEDWRACLRRKFAKADPRAACAKVEAALRSDIYEIVSQSSVPNAERNRHSVARMALDRLYGIEYGSLLALVRRGCVATDIGVVCLEHASEETVKKTRDN